jgi:cellulose biosynthesis protein BcsQ
MLGAALFGWQNGRAISSLRLAAMNDLFTFLKNLIRDETEVIAAFVMGVIITAGSLTYLIYWLFGRFYKKKIAELESDLKKTKEAEAEARGKLKEAQKAEIDLKKKVKDRKTKIGDYETEISKLNAKIEEAKRAAAQLQQQLDGKDTRNADRITKYNELVLKHNNLVANAKTLKKQLGSLNEQAKLFEMLQGQLWDVPVDKAKIPPFRPLTKNRAVIIALINLKGGVGKTTLTANIAATYCRALNKRVLAIDLDFQASLTNLCLPADRVGELQVGHGRLIENVFADSSQDLAKLAYANMTETGVLKLHLLATSGLFANVEEQAKARWIMNFAGPDVRSILRSALHGAAFQDNFDVILIDCPPRWTTSSINAIACCDYVLVPTLLDRVSSEAVPRLLRWLRDLKASSAELYGNFKILGVVGNRAYPRAGLILQEREIWKASPGKCEQTWLAPVHHFATIIQDKSEFRRAANHREFAALHPDLQPIFLNLVQEIEAGRSAHESP